jgi:hypothetical protein
VVLDEDKQPSLSFDKIIEYELVLLILLHLQALYKPIVICYYEPRQKKQL